jgi:hypothetical protein
MLGAQSEAGIHSFSGKKNGHCSEDTADFIVFNRTRLNPSIARNPCSHFSFGLRAILGCERTPSKANREDREVAKESTTNNVVSRTVELEKKRLSRLQNTELPAAAGLPEIYLVN